MTRKILHITAGGEDWAPTVEELTHLVQMFQEYTTDKTPEDYVKLVATRPNIRLQVLDEVPNVLTRIEANAYIGGDLLEAYTHFNNGGLHLTLHEQLTKYGPVHTLKIGMLNMGQRVEFSLPLFKSLADTFTIIGDLMRKRAVDPRYLAPVDTKLTVRPYDINTTCPGDYEARTSPDTATSSESNATEKAAEVRNQSVSPSSTLDANESDPGMLWAEIHRLRDQLKGPDGFETWRDAAIAERQRRVAETAVGPNGESSIALRLWSKASGIPMEKLTQLLHEAQQEALNERAAKQDGADDATQ